MVSFSLSIDTYIGRYWSAWREVRTRRARSRTRRRGRGHGKPRGWAGDPPARRDADQRQDHEFTMQQFLELTRDAGSRVAGMLWGVTRMGLE